VATQVQEKTKIDPGEVRENLGIVHLRRQNLKRPINQTFKQQGKGSPGEHFGNC
jgi:hypothetical protein